MDMAEAGGASGAVVQRLRKTTCMSFVAASEQWERNKNWKGRQNETFEPVSGPGDWRCRLQRTVRQHAVRARMPAFGLIGIRMVIIGIRLQTWMRVIVDVDV